MPPPGDFSKCSKKFEFSKIGRNMSKSAPGSVLSRFGLEIPIQSEKLYKDDSSNQYFVNFLKLWFSIKSGFWLLLQF